MCRRPSHRVPTLLTAQSSRQEDVRLPTLRGKADSVRASTLSQIDPRGPPVATHSTNAHNASAPCPFPREKPTRCTRPVIQRHRRDRGARCVCSPPRQVVPGQAPSPGGWSARPPSPVVMPVSVSKNRCARPCPRVPPRCSGPAILRPGCASPGACAPVASRSAGHARRSGVCTVHRVQGVRPRAGVRPEGRASCLAPHRAAPGAA
jgi:hypothetical protein